MARYKLVLTCFAAGIKDRNRNISVSFCFKQLEIELGADTMSSQNPTGSLRV